MTLGSSDSKLFEQGFIPHPHCYSAKQLVNITMGATNRKEVEINMLKQSTINQRLQESEDVPVLVFPEQEDEIYKHHPTSGYKLTQTREWNQKTKLSHYEKDRINILYCVMQLNEPCPRQTFLALNI